MFLLLLVFLILTGASIQFIGDGPLSWCLVIATLLLFLSSQFGTYG